MEGSAAPLGAERRRLAPLTGPTVWGSATPRRSSPLSKGGRVRPRRGGRTQPPYLCASEDFHSPRSPDLAAPPPPRVKIPARPGRANRKSAAERRPPIPRAEAAAQVETAARAARRARSVDSRPWSLAAGLGLAQYLPPTRGSHRPPLRGPGVPGAGQRRVKERAPPPPASLPPPLGKSPK